MRLFVIYFKKYSFLLGLVLLAIILLKSDLPGIFQSLRNIKILYLSFATFLLFPLMATKSLCWNYLNKKQNIRYSLKDSLLIYWAGFYLGFITPGRLGELSKVLYLKEDGYPLSKSLTGVILDRISDLIFLLVFICFGFLFFAVPFQKQVLSFILGLIILSSLLFLSLKTSLIKILLKKFFFLFVPLKYRESWKVNFRDFIDNVKIYNFTDYLIVFLITVASWSVYYLQMYILARGMNFDIPFLYFTVALTVAGLVTLIPISISGLGTRDAILIFLFAPFLIAKEKVVAFSALVFLMAFIATLLGLICWFIKPRRNLRRGF